MLTYFGAVVKLPIQDRFEAGSRETVPLWTVPLWQCRRFYAALAGQEPHKPAMTSQEAAQTISGLRCRCKTHRGPSVARAGI